MLSLIMSIISAIMFSVFGASLIVTIDSKEDENLGLYIIAVICMFIAGISILWFINII